MLAELAAANAAFQVIKTTLQNTGELASAGQAIASWFNAKSQLQQAVNKKGQRTDLEEFLALEELKQKEEELKQMMIYLGRPGLHQDWVRFQADAARARREEARLILKKKMQRDAKIWAWFEGILVAFLSVFALAAAAFVIWLIVTKGGAR